MKKQIMVAVIALIPSLGFAKISDFNALIAENTKSQNELHNTVQGNLAEARKAEARQRIVVVENSGSSYNAPTRKSLLAFKKEKTHHQASESKTFERLAHEISISGE